MHSFKSSFGSLQQPFRATPKLSKEQKHNNNVGLLLCLKLVRKSLRLVQRAKHRKGLIMFIDMFQVNSFVGNPSTMVICQALLGLGFVCCSFQTPSWLRLGWKQRVSNGSSPVQHTLSKAAQQQENTK
jgi:hypothetical protein